MLIRRLDASATISAKGAGYWTTVCRDGSGPSAYPLSGGRGGCSVRDSGGGGNITSITFEFVFAFLLMTNS